MKNPPDMGQALWHLQHAIAAVHDEMDASSEEHLRAAAMIRRQLDELIAGEVRSARSMQTSWEKIGAALGVSKQAAWERYWTADDAELSGRASTS